MKNTQERLSIGKGVSPFYLYATLLWPALVPRYKAKLEAGEPPARAMDLAASSVLSEQVSLVSIPKRFSLAMRDTWYLQTQMHRRHGNRAAKLLENAKFRAAYDFILMREESGEDLDGLGPWWTDYQKANHELRQEMVNRLGNPEKRKRRRSGKRRSPKKPHTSE